MINNDVVGVQENKMPYRKFQKNKMPHRKFKLARLRYSSGLKINK